MDRPAWLAERQAAVVATYDAEATYDENEYPTQTQREWVSRLLRLVPPGGVVLDAPCGTGRYFPMIVTAGFRVVGVDRSEGMLSRAGERRLATALERMALQELSYDHGFDGAMTVDAMENVPPEDWPVVVANLHRAVRPGAFLYMTVEEVDGSQIEEAYRALSAAGAPAVLGEVVEGDVAGYHFYPGRERVLRWFADAGWDVVDEHFKQEVGWGYRHFLLRSRG